MTNNRTGKEQEENSKAGKLAGTGAGVIAGAQLGTVLIPIPVVGTFTGALVGGLFGNKIGKRFGGTILDKMDASAETVCNDQSDKANLAKELDALRELHEAGVLSDDEFKAAKAKLLGL